MRVVHFNNATGGGVLSIVRNLLFYQQNLKIEQHIVYTVQEKQSNIHILKDLYGIKSERTFFYSPDWNFYYTCKKLSNCLPDAQTVIVANDWLELGMVSHLGLKNPVVLILHGDYEYYYCLAVKHAINIDIFICIASNIAENLKILLPNRKGDIYYQRFPVKVPVQKSIFSGMKKLIFVGRCEKAKGYHLLPFIEQELQRLFCKVSWTIVGDGTIFDKVYWPPASEVFFLGEVANDELLKILYEHDVIILPSLAEGMPVSIVEAMKAGVIPIVNDLPGGIQELVENSLTGYKIEQNNTEAYALAITGLFHTPALVQKLSLNCMSKASGLFNPEQNTLAFELLYEQAEKQNKQKTKLKIYGSRLDKQWIPNVLVYQIRKRNKSIFKL